MDERVSFIMDYLAAQWTVSVLCLEYGISRPTVYKYIARFEELGIQGLLDFSRAPHIIANRTHEENREHNRFSPSQTSSISS